MPREGGRMQISLFDGDKKFKIDKPIRLIELFAGYGSQHFALEYLGVEFESWKICEWAVKSIQAYKDAHFSNDNTNYSNTLTKEEVFEYLASKGISSNYNEPMTYSQIKRLGEERARQIYNNIVATHNLVNIQQVKGRDLQVVDTDKYCYIMTYSFPCQDLSSAGLGAGMAKGAGTRSGMLWEVERILDEIVASGGGHLPQVLLMENVPEVKGSKNIKHFSSWVQKLESLGYYCKWAVLNAKGYGVPQNRERCFMVSILGNGCYYDFPTPRPLDKRLKDVLENNVDEKYYLSDKLVNYFIENSVRNEAAGNGFRFNPQNGAGLAKTVTTKAGSRMDDNFISEPCLEQVAQIQGPYESTSSVYSPNGLAPTINTCGGGNREPKILQENLKTQLCNKLIQSGVLRENYVINHSYTNGLNGKNKNSRQTVEDYIETTNNIMPTLTTRPDCLGIVVNDNPKCLGGIGEKKSNGGTQYYQQDRIYSADSVAMCHPANLPSGSYMYAINESTMQKDNYLIEPKPLKYVELKLLETIKKNGGELPEAADLYNSRPINNGIAGTLSTSCGNDCGCGSFAVINDYRIRKLTPKECFRLMGVKDEDFEKIAQNQSNASLYHLAGDSIVVDVLMAIFKEIL